MDENIRVSSGNTGMVLCLAINYSGRTELVDAVRVLAERAKRGELEPEDIDENVVGEALYTDGHAGPGPADPHGRRDARQQFPALADFATPSCG